MSKPGDVKLDEKRIKAIEHAIGIGSPYFVAAQVAGISEASFFAWKKEAKEIEEKLSTGEVIPSKLTDKDKKLLGFLEAIKKGEKTLITANLANIQVAAKKQWQASAWVLERRFPNEYGRRDKLELSGDASNPLRYANLSDDELDAKLKEARERLDRYGKTYKGARTKRR